MENRAARESVAGSAQRRRSRGELSLDSQRYKVILSFREDFLPASRGGSASVPSIMRNRLRLLPMSGEQAFEAVHTTAPQLVDAAARAATSSGFVAAAQDADGAAAYRERP